MDEAAAWVRDQTEEPAVTATQKTYRRRLSTIAAWINANLPELEAKI